MKVSDIFGAVLQSAINLGVRVLGKSINPDDYPWVKCPIGPPQTLGTRVYDEIAAAEELEQRVSENAGLLASFADLNSEDFDAEDVDPRIRAFYERTAAYELEAWSDVSLIALPLLWMLVMLVSRRMDQLVFPLSALELSGGMSNEVIELTDRSTGKRIYTGWRRRLISNKSIIYAGLYSTTVPPNYGKACVRVSFPVPRGNATVILRPKADADGSFWLISQGRRFGDPGFYRVVKTAENKWSVRYLPQLVETFHVYVHEDGLLRTEHQISILGIRVLTLHYKMRSAGRAQIATESLQAAETVWPGGNGMPAQ
jgi:hypothetical protein